jgi:SAM-dependent MidA family methyltransferase
VSLLGRRIARLIEREGPLPLAQFMAIALHDPEHGYYATREPLGAAGDFTTSPEISQIFGELLGLWCAQAWLDQGKPKAAHLVELGPGRGTLLADALRAARIVPEFLASVEILLVEMSPGLQAAQQALLQDAGVPIHWVRRWDEVPKDRPLFLLANEFLDALPICQFVKTERGWCERMVLAGGSGQLVSALSPLPTPIDVPAQRGMPPLEAVYEISPAATALVEDVSRTIAQHSGAALFIDYGYAAGGFGDTLQAVRQQSFADVFSAPGESDLSAHVDFATMLHSAESGGSAAYGPIDQGDLLRSLGIESRATALSQRQPHDADAIATAVDRLTSPAQMGTLFKAFAIAPKHGPKPPGF